jgi:hypothetical protein
MSDIHIYIEREQPVKVITLEPSGKRGPAGPNSVTSATTSDGTCDLSLDTLVVGTGTASGVRSVALGQSTASGDLSFAQGLSTASNDYAFASGDASTASGYGSFAINNSTASGDLSFAAGGGTTASGDYSLAFGFSSVAMEIHSAAIGRRAKSIHAGASVESDSEDADVESTTTDEKTFRFANGYRFLGGSATFSAGVTVEGTLTADHIHGNLAGSVYAHVRAGETLAKGDPVYISGSHGQAPDLIPIVSKADASNAAKMPAVGIMDAALANNASGHMVITGTITELNTNAYAVNSVLYVATGGGFTATPPAANSQAVAIVERSNTNNGAVIVKVNGLASSGGNGASDANKLVRFSSAGGISQTGGTLTDMTYAGTAAFTSTTRPTSAGTGTPAATSLITRTDGERAFLRNLRSVLYTFDSGWSQLTTTGGSVNVTNNFLRVEGGNGASAGSATAYLLNRREGIGVSPTGTFTSVDFSNPININFALRTRNFNIASSLNWAFIAGNTENYAAGISNMVRTGTAADKGWVGLQCVSGNVTIIAVNGTSTVAQSGVIDTFVNGYNQKAYRLEIASGVVNCYSSQGLLLGSLSTSIPTTQREFSGPVICVDSSATANQIGIIVQHLSFDW